MKTTRTPLNRCLECGYIIDAATETPDNPTERPPRPGDIAVCIACGCVHLFADDLTLRKPNDEEWLEIADDPSVVMSRAAVARYNRDRSYEDPRFSERACERCGKPYRGPALYCSFECAAADA